MEDPVVLEEEDLPQKVTDASIQQLKRLVLAYQTNFPLPPVAPVVGPVHVLACHLLRELNNDEARFYFAVCVTFLRACSKVSPFGGYITDGLIASAKKTHFARQSAVQSALAELEHRLDGAIQRGPAHADADIPNDLNPAFADLQNASICGLAI